MCGNCAAASTELTCFSRYSLSKLVEMYAIREFAAGFPVSETGVIINMVSPGLCSTNLGHDAAPSRRALQGVLRAMMARTAEEGSRTILHGVIAGEESHGKHLSGCQIKEYVDVCRGVLCVGTGALLICRIR